MNAFFCKFALLCAAALGWAQSASTAHQTITFRVASFSRAQLSAAVVAPAGRSTVQALSTLQLASTTADLRVLVRADQPLPPGVSLAVRAGSAGTSPLGASDTDLALPAGTRPATLDLSYELRGSPTGVGLRVVYTILDR